MPSSADDPVAAALTAGVTKISDAVAASALPNPIVVIDGRSGAGKTTLAEMLADDWPLPVPVQLVALDAIYPGWDGMDAGVKTALRDILLPHARGEIATWRRWDWVRGAHAESHTVDPTRGLILEGCGALTTETAARAAVRVWVDAPETARKIRALARDGDVFRPHWDGWSAQEARHIARDDPAGLADIIVRVP